MTRVASMSTNLLATHRFIELSPVVKLALHLATIRKVCVGMCRSGIRFVRLFSLLQRHEQTEDPLSASVDLAILLNLQVMMVSATGAQGVSVEPCESRFRLKQALRLLSRRYTSPCVAWTTRLVTTRYMTIAPYSTALH